MSIKIRRTFIEPHVDPAQAPTNISANKPNTINLGHKSKLAELYPVVVIIDTTWNDEYLKDSQNP